MEITLKDAFKNVFTERYNKSNIFQYFILLLIAGIASVFMSMDVKTFDPNTIITMCVSYLIYIVVCVMVMGIQVVTVNNGYMGKNQVFPNFIDEFKNVVINGIKFYGGFIIMYFATVLVILACTIFIVPLCIFAKSVSESIFVAAIIISILFAALLLLFLILMFCGLVFNFTRTLEFEDMLNVKKAFNFMKACRREFSKYFLKSILLGIIALIIIVPIFFLVIAAIAIPSVFNGVEASELQGSAAGAVVGVIYGVLISLFQMDLEIQFLNSTKEKFVEIPAPADEQDEYLSDDNQYDNDESQDYYEDNDNQ